MAKKKLAPGFQRFEFRPGVGGFPKFRGLELDGDAAAIHPNTFRVLKNTRQFNEDLQVRPGQSKLTTSGIGSVRGIFETDPDGSDDSGSQKIWGFQADTNITWGGGTGLLSRPYGDRTLAKFYMAQNGVSDGGRVWTRLLVFDPLIPGEINLLFNSTGSPHDVDAYGVDTETIVQITDMNAQAHTVLGQTMTFDLPDVGISGEPAIIWANNGIIYFVVGNSRLFKYDSGIITRINGNDSDAFGYGFSFDGVGLYSLHWQSTFDIINLDTLGTVLINNSIGTISVGYPASQFEDSSPIRAASTTYRNYGALESDHFMSGGNLYLSYGPGGTSRSGISQVTPSLVVTNFDVPNTDPDPATADYTIYSIWLDGGVIYVLALVVADNKSHIFSFSPGTGIYTDLGIVTSINPGNVGIGGVYIPSKRRFYWGQVGNPLQFSGVGAFTGAMTAAAYSAGRPISTVVPA